MSLPRRPRIHVLYEHGPDLAPFSTAYIRLIRPLGHPLVRAHLDVSFGRRLPGEQLDAVIVDRLWQPLADLPRLERLIGAVRGMGARLLHALDDNFLDLPLERRDWATADQPAALKRLMEEADGFLLSTPMLAERLAWTGRPVMVVPNALDERLLDAALVGADMPQPPARDPGESDGGVIEAGAPRPSPQRPLTIGYMGTFTHDGDLALVLPALRTVCARHAGRVRLQLVGVAGQEGTLAALADLPLDVLRLTPPQMAYPLFLPWFTQALRWDIGIAPLADTPFNRAKSDLKHLDYAAQGAAGIFSRVTSYRHTVRDGETGLLVPNSVAAWEEGLERLIGDATLRARLATGAADYLRRERTLAVLAPRWTAAVLGLLGGGVGERFGEGAMGLIGPMDDQMPDEAQSKDATSRATGGGIGPMRPIGPIAPSPTPSSTPPTPLRLAVLLERDGAGRPLAPSHLRLLRPLGHPALADRLEARFPTRPDARGMDAMVVDRLWRPDISLPLMEEAIFAARAEGAAFIYSIDDNLLDLPAERADWPSAEHLTIVEHCLAAADGVLVSSQALADRLRPLTKGRMAVLPNALDERLLPRTTRGERPTEGLRGERPLTVGYMGTATHDDDLAMVLPALTELAARHPGRLNFEVIGGARRRSSREAWRAAGLPVRFLNPWPTDEEYPSFMPWFTARADWDIAIAPLGDTPFRRCKSDIKFLDYCALETAIVLSDVTPYAATVRHGETGLLVANTPAAWLAGLECLMADAPMRARLGRAARRYLVAERVLAVRAGDWDAAIRSLLGAG
jgi:processive 1,2-diacylglycerol beta-glucosyltransferase